MTEIVTRVRNELVALSDDAVRRNGGRFFREDVKLYGVKTATVTGIATRHFNEVSRRDKSDIFAACEVLWASGFLEESFIACRWSHEVRDRYEPDDFAIFEKWLTRYVSNWASCDTLCNHTIGTFIEMYPSSVAQLKRWTASANRWMRRGSAVSLVIPARNGRFLNDVFEIADALLHDNDDMVRKGYGWVLKAASEAHQEAVFGFVMERRAAMPRTALRYAIEKMPKELRTRAMAT